MNMIRRSLQRCCKGCDCHMRGDLRYFDSCLTIPSFVDTYRDRECLFVVGRNYILERKTLEAFGYSQEEHTAPVTNANATRPVRQGQAYLLETLVALIKA